MSEAPQFRFWVRRSPGEGAVYSIRFEVDGGKGLLRVARPGVLVDPPAREFGFEERLTSAQVRASRFLHVWDGGRKRQAYVLSRLTDNALNELPMGGWEELSVVNDGGFCWLVHRSPEELDPGSVEPIDLRNAPAPEPEDVPISAIEAIEDLPGPVDVGGAELLSVEETQDESTPIEAVTAEHLSPAPDAPITEEDILPDAALTLFGRPTALVRHLRRDKLRDRQQLMDLTVELEKLRKALDEARERESELRTRLARYQRRLKARESALPK